MLTANEYKETSQAFQPNLFSFTQNNNNDPEEIPTKTKESSISTFYTQAWQRYYALYEQFIVDCGKITKEEKLKDTTEGQPTVFNFNTYELKKYIESTASEIFNSIIRAAEVKFAPGSASLEINKHPYRQKFLYSYTSENLKDLDFGALWSALEKEYGGISGINEAYNQAAKKILNNIYIDFTTPIKRDKKGNAILSKNVWVNSYRKADQGENRLSYDCAHRLRTLLQNLALVAEWDNNSLLKNDLLSVADRFIDHYYIQSRQKITIGAKNELTIITYVKKFEFLLAPDFLSKFQLFLSTFAMDEIKNRTR